MASANDSMAMANKRGDKMPPCLVPLYNGKLSDLPYEIITETKSIQSLK